MRSLMTLFLSALPHLAAACSTPVCLVDPETLMLPRVITFDDVQSGFGPGFHVDDVLPLDGARFGERFAGQTIAPLAAHDQITGAALSPLTLLPGDAGQNFSVVRFMGNAMLNGYGVAGFPNRDGQGEGAIAVLFDNDQDALAFDLRGGEAGAAQIMFLRRDGSVIHKMTIDPTGEFTVAFQRRGTADIAGFVLTNTDPQGIAFDTLRFGRPPDLS